MKLKGRESVLAIDTVRIPKPGRNGENDVILHLQSLPVGYDELLEKEMPSPSVIQYCKYLGYARDPDSGKLLLQGGKPVREYDTSDSKYIAAGSIRQQLVVIAYCYTALKSVNPELEIDTKEENFKDKAKFYTALREEMTAFGFSSGDLLIIANRALEISNISRERIEEGKLGFLSGTEDVESGEERKPLEEEETEQSAHIQ